MHHNGTTGQRDDAPLEKAPPPRAAQHHSPRGRGALPSLAVVSALRPSEARPRPRAPPSASAPPRNPSPSSGSGLGSVDSPPSFSASCTSARGKFFGTGPSSAASNRSALRVVRPQLASASAARLCPPAPPPKPPPPLPPPPRAPPRPPRATASSTFASAAAARTPPRARVWWRRREGSPPSRLSPLRVDSTSLARRRSDAANSARSAAFSRSDRSARSSARS